MNIKYKDFKFISVIVPVYNEEKNIGLLLKRLLNLNFPKDKFEIIVVDNNSKDNTPEIIKKYKVIYLNEIKQSSYAARNKGIKKAKSNILAFIDGDCIPDKNWLKNAIKHFIEEEVDIIAGNIIVSDSINVNNSITNLYQLITLNERNKYSEKEGRCSGGNLIAKKEVFNNIGYFEERLISGGDGEWTKRATNHGFKLKYYNDVKVYHPLEEFNSILRRAIRIGHGIGQIRFLLCKSSIPSFQNDTQTKNILKWLLKIYCNSIRIFWDNSKCNVSNKEKLLLSFLSILLTSASLYGIAKVFIYSKLSRKVE